MNFFHKKPCSGKSDCFMCYEGDDMKNAVKSECYASTIEGHLTYVLNYGIEHTEHPIFNLQTMNEDTLAIFPIDMTKREMFCMLPYISRYVQQHNLKKLKVRWTKPYLLRPTYRYITMDFGNDTPTNGGIQYDLPNKLSILDRVNNLLP